MKISEVSEQSGLSIDTLRYYEKIGLLPAVSRTDSGIRNFNELDLHRELHQVHAGGGTAH